MIQYTSSRFRNSQTVPNWIRRTGEQETAGEQTAYLRAFWTQLFPLFS
jgi:hypothetical protein